MFQLLQINIQLHTFDPTHIALLLPEPEDIKTSPPQVLGLIEEKSKARLSILVLKVKCQ